MTGTLSINNIADCQLNLSSTDAWVGIGFNDGAATGQEFIWYNGTNGTFAIGGGGSNVANKKLHVDGGMTIGSGYDATAVTANSLKVEGALTVGGAISGNNQTMTLSSGSNTYHVFDGTDYKFYVNVDGGISNVQANDGNLSDEREKKNIEALGSQWDVLKQWDLKKFHYKADEDSDSKKYGVIAQDVEVNHPDLVKEFKLTETVNRKAVKEQQMMWMAIKALQEALTRIETLEARVAFLET